MKKVKQNILRFSLRIMGLMIVFLMSCQSNNEKKETEELAEKPDSVIVKDTLPLKDTLKNEIKPIANKPKPIRKDSIRKLVRPDKNPPVCKYGVIMDDDMN